MSRPRARAISSRPTSNAAIGVAYAALAYLSWGLMPLYWRAVDWLPADQIVGHRVVWSVLVLAVLLAAFRRFGDLLRVLGDPSMLRWLLLSAVLISINWLVFVWAVAHERVLQASLGYFINPLVNVALGMLFLQERLTPRQRLAVVLAGAGVAWQTLGLGVLPWVSLALAGSFGFYGLVRKTAPVDALLGLAVETLLLAPLALAYLLWADPQWATFTRHGWSGALLVAQAGLVTALPLLWFANGARRLRYATLGFVQYLAPTGHLLLAVLVFGEPFTAVHAGSFGLIWLALALYTWDISRDRRHQRPAVPRVR